MRDKAKEIRKGLFWVLSSVEKTVIFDLGSAVNSFGVVDRKSGVVEGVFDANVDANQEYYSPIVEGKKRIRLFYLRKEDVQKDDLFLKGTSDPLAIVPWSEDIKSLGDLVDALLKRQCQSLPGLLKQESVLSAFAMSKAACEKKRLANRERQDRIQKMRGASVSAATSKMSLSLQRKD
jgi:hypothetical protein